MEVNEIATTSDQVIVLRHRIAVLEAEVAQERTQREAAEQQYFETRHALVVLQTQSDRLQQLLELRSAASSVAPEAPTAKVVQADAKPCCEQDVAAPAAPVPSPVPAPEPQRMPAAPVPPQTVATTPANSDVTANPSSANLSTVIASTSSHVAVAPVEQSTQSNEDKRGAARMPSRTSASFWRAGWREALHCTICDKSSSGARLRRPSDPFAGREKELFKGDQITLMFDGPGERTSVMCTVMWIDGTQFGVRYTGQFITEVKQARAPRYATSTNAKKTKTGLFSRLG